MGIIMDASHDQNFICKILKICCRTCVFCCSKYPIPVCIFFLFFILYLFFPSVFTFLIYSLPVVGLAFIGHRIVLGIDCQKIKRVEEADEKRKKFAKSRRSFKSNRSHLIRRNTNKKSDDDTDVEDKDDIFSKTLKDLLSEKKPKEVQAINVDSVVGRGDSSSNYSQSLRPKVYDNVNGDHKDELEGENWDVSEEEEDERQYSSVRWTEYDQKNVMDLGLSEVERNKRLESLIIRRRSRKNLGFQEKGATGNSKNVQISAIKTKINPFLEDNSCGKKSPGSAPSSLVTTHNPFDIPYDPNEEKLDLTGDNFNDEFTVGHQKEPIYSRHQSFSIGAFSHPESTHDKHDISFYKDLSTKQKSGIGHEISTVENIGDSNHPKEEGESSERIHEEDETERKTQDVNHDASNAQEDRKADIAFFYGGKKRVGHAPSISMVSDLQVEVSEEGSAPMLDDVEIEKDRESWLNSSNLSQETENEPQSLNSETVQNDHIHELSGDSQISVVQNAPDGLTEVAVGQAQVTSSSPKSVLQREISTDPASPYNFTSEDHNERQL